jgi:MoaA/NifB/PqqE/SkfB family radical SAM enzyme
MNQTIESIDFWYKIISLHKDIEETDKEYMVNLLQQELPTLSSLIMERTCNLSCSHCVFQDEKSSKRISQGCDLESIILTIASQLPINSSVIHEGRVIRDWHIPILAKIKEIRPDLALGLIDNGTYLNVKDKFQAHKLHLDWLDISIDGDEATHNRQRGNKKAYATAIEGLRQARSYINRNGRITSLFTGTKINYANVYEAALSLMEEKLVDEFHVTPAGPTFRDENLVMDETEWVIFWESFCKAHALGERFGIPVYIRFYNHDDIRKFANVVGYDAFRAAFTNRDDIRVSRGSISFLINGIRILYVPVSICPTETFVIDVDGVYRLAYCVKFTLEELRNKRKDDKDLSAYSVALIQKGDSYSELYKKGAKQWWEVFGKVHLQAEKKLFNNLIFERR